MKKPITLAIISLASLVGDAAPNQVHTIEKLIDGLTAPCAIDENLKNRRENTRRAIMTNFDYPELALWDYIDAIADGEMVPKIPRPVEDAFEGLRLGFETKLTPERSRDLIRKLARAPREIHEFPPGIAAYEDPKSEEAGFGFGPALTPEGKEIIQRNHQINQLIMESIRTLNAANQRQDDELIESLATADHSEIRTLVNTRATRKPEAK
jgi:hypothetical protein